MRSFLARQNILNFRKLLESEQDPGRRTTLEGLLKREEDTLRSAEKDEQNS